MEHPPTTAPKPIGKTVAVGMPVARHPPHRSVPAEFPHTALILDEWRQSERRGRDAVRAERAASDQRAARCAANRHWAAYCDDESYLATASGADPGRRSSPQALPAH